MFTERIKELANRDGITIAQMLRDLGMGHATFSAWVKRGTIPNGEALQKIANYFDVSVDYLLGKKDLAESKFGELWDADKRETLKADARNKLCDESKNIENGTPKLTVQEKVKLQETVLRALFSRSVEGYEYRLSHPYFSEYVAMILGQDKCCLLYLDSETYDELKRRYGTKPGYIKSGSTYYDPQHKKLHEAGEEAAIGDDVFWQHFYELCSEDNISPNNVAKILGLSSGTVATWENGKVPHYKTLIDIADYFDCSIDYLLGRTDTPRGTLGDDLSDTEKKLIAAYRNKPEMQSSVNKLLDVQETDASQLLEKIKVRIAAGELNPTDGKIAAFGGYTKPKSEEEAERLAEIESLLKSIRESQKDSD